MRRERSILRYWLFRLQADSSKTVATVAPQVASCQPSTAVTFSMVRAWHDGDAIDLRRWRRASPVDLIAGA
jgi:hypothetical protein